MKTNYAKYDPRIDSSEGAEDYWADRNAESGSQEAAGFYPDETVILITGGPDEAGELVTFCPCGCGQVPQGKGRTFRMGHDARLKGILIRAHVAGFEVARVGGGGITSSSALTYAQFFGWGAYLEAAAKREAERKDRKARPNAPRAPKPKGPQVGDVQSLKIGRWNYEATLVGVWDGGKTLEYTYADKKGNTKTHTVKVS